MGACRGNTRLTRMIPRDAERFALIARGCMMRWTDATSINIYTCGITDCFRSVRTLRCRAASASTGRRGQRGGVAAAPAECPTTMHPLRVGGSESKSLTGTTVDNMIKISKRKRRTYRILHRIDHLYTSLSVKEETGPLLRDRERIATVSNY